MHFISTSRFNDVADEEVLSSGHLLVGDIGGEVPEPVIMPNFCQLHILKPSSTAGVTGNEISSMPSYLGK